MIEREIVIGLITSTEYIEKVRKIMSPHLFESSIARMLVKWCLEYFDKYKEAPKISIKNIVYQAASEGTPKDVIDEIESEILPQLNEEYLREGVNVEYLTDITKAYVRERNLIILSDQIKTLVAKNRLIEAENIAYNYKSGLKENPEWVDIGAEESLKRIESAFAQNQECLIKYPGALGEMWNSQLVRDGFVALMGMEKRGKTFFLLDMGMRAALQGKKVAFFEAGDMSENQMLVRIAVYLAKKSNKEEYCNIMYEPIKDCVFNQINECEKSVRECDFGVFEDKTAEEVRNCITLEELIEKYEKYKEYRPCTNCIEWRRNPWGAVWVAKIPSVQPLSNEEAKAKLKEFYEKNRRMRLSTHPAKTLSTREIDSILSLWEKQDGFVPDVVIVDYADIMTDETKEFRHQQNQIWMGLRSLSQSRHCLVITATQTDADSYSKNLLKWDNFSEDKRKYGHVTAMYGLNQDPEGREKKLKIMRINEIVVREGDFSISNQCRVLQNLSRGRAFLTSFW